MLKFIELHSAEEFRSLVGNEILIIEWTENCHYAKGIKVYQKWFLKPNGGGGGEDELICQKKDNIYFNTFMFENGESWAKAAYVIKECE